MKLSKEQTEFFLEFFKLDEDRTPGWKNIATKLLEKGSCIVAGDSCLWKGGIGNFIKTENTDEAVGCLVYKFDIENFMQTSWYIDTRNSFLDMMDHDLRKLESKRNEIAKL